MPDRSRVARHVWRQGKWPPTKNEPSAVLGFREESELTCHRLVWSGVQHPHSGLFDTQRHAAAKEVVQEARGVPDRAGQQEVGHGVVVEPVQGELRRSLGVLEEMVPDRPAAQRDVRDYLSRELIDYGARVERHRARDRALERHGTERLRPLLVGRGLARRLDQPTALGPAAEIRTDRQEITAAEIRHAAVSRVREELLIRSARDRFVFPEHEPGRDITTTPREGSPQGAILDVLLIPAMTAIDTVRQA